MTVRRVVLMGVGLGVGAPTLRDSSPATKSAVSPQLARAMEARGRKAYTPRLPGPPGALAQPVMPRNPESPPPRPPTPLVPVEVTVEKTDPCTARIAFTVSPEEFDGEVARLLKQVGQQTRMKGYRPGKVPVAILERTHGKEVRHEARNRFLQKAYEQAVKDNELRPFTHPRIDLGEGELLAGQEFKHEFEVSLRPDFELGEYKGLAVDDELTPVSDEEVEAAIDQAAKNQAHPEPAGEEGLPEDGMALCKIELVQDGEVVFERDGMRLGPKAQVPGVDPEAFEKALIGTVDGDVRELDLKFPDDFEVAAAAGKDGTCRITVTQAFKVITPTREELMELMGVEDDAEMKTKARESLEQANTDHEHRRQETALLDQLLEQRDMDLPTSMVEDQVAGRINALRNELEGQTLPEEKITEEVSVQEPQFRAEAVKGAKAYFLIEVIAEKEGLQVTQPELQAELKLIAQRNRSPLEEVQKYYQEENLIPQLALEIVERKVRMFLRENAKISGASAEGK